MEFDAQEIAEFKNEAIELLEDAEAHLLQMENPSDFSKSYAAVFRAFHSLKGASGMLGLNDLRDHMHKLENIFHQFQNATHIQGEQITFFLSGVDAARVLLDGGKVAFKYEFSSQENPQQIEKKRSTESVTAEKNLPLIYLIDDEEDMLEIFSSMLERHGYKVISFSHPRLAIDKAETHAPDLVLTDMNMPDLTGMDVLKKLKEIDSEIPVIFISGYLDKSILIEALNLGVFAVIEKPIKEGMLINYVAQALNRREVWRLLNKSIDLVLFQLKETENFLNAQGKRDLVNVMKSDAHHLLEARRSLKSLKVT